MVYAITAIKGGASFWHNAMLPTVGIPKPDFLPEEIYSMEFTQWYIVYGGLVLLFSLVNSIVTVMNIRRERNQDPWTPLLGLLPTLVTWAMVPAYLHLQPIILNYHLVPFIIFVGLVNAYSVGQMIVKHLTKSKFPYQNVMLWPLAWGIFDSVVPHLGLWPSALGDGVYQVAFVFLCVGLSIGIYGSFVVRTSAPSTRMHYSMLTRE